MHILHTCCFCGQNIETQYYNIWQVEGHSKIVCIGCHAELEKKYDSTYLPPEDIFKFNNKGELSKCTK